MVGVRLLTAVSLLTTAAVVGAPLEFERIGVPVRETGHRLLFSTPHPDGYHIAWADHNSPDFSGLLGVRLDTGEVQFVSLEDFGHNHVALVHGADGAIYAYCGRRHGHFVRYDVATGELRDLGVPAPNPLPRTQNVYFASGPGAMSPDGRFYVGTYPGATLVWVDTHTGETGSAGRFPQDPRNRHMWPSVAVSADNVVYCPVGQHHQELYAWDPATEQATQILPEELTSQPGVPRVWRAADGHVYGRSGEVSFRCTPTGILTDVEALPAPEEPVMAGDWRVSDIDRQGMVKLTHAVTGEERTLQTDYEGRPIRIYAVGTEWEGRIWGGTVFPARVFSYDLETGELEDHGRRTGGRIQVYDIMGTSAGLLISSYVSALVDIWNPFAPQGQQWSGTLERGENQERPIQWARGPDGRYYTGTRPIKGHLGGALGRVDVDIPQARWWIKPVGDLSVMGVAPVSETNQVLCATSVAGGTGAIATETEAVVFLWDCEQEQVVHVDRPLAGARTYQAAARAETGLIYLLVNPAPGPGVVGQYLAWDPVRREAVYVGELPGIWTDLRFPFLHEEPVGPEGLLVGLLGDAVFAISPEDHSLRVLGRHPSIAAAHGFMVTADGTLYYGSGGELWRARLLPPEG